MEIHISAHSGTYQDTAGHLTALYDWLSRISIKDMTELDFDIKVDIVTSKKKKTRNKKHHEQETEKEVPQG